jgi:hypothetical protein
MLLIIEYDISLKYGPVITGLSSAETKMDQGKIRSQYIEPDKKYPGRFIRSLEKRRLNEW